MHVFHEIFTQIPCKDKQVSLDDSSRLRPSENHLVCGGKSKLEHFKIRKVLITSRHEDLSEVSDWSWEYVACSIACTSRSSIKPIRKCYLECYFCTLAIPRGKTRLLHNYALSPISIYLLIFLFYSIIHFIYLAINMTLSQQQNIKKQQP